jgi:hypothetical protein
MIEKERYLQIAEKYGEFASWAVWAEQGSRPKSHMGDLTIFDLDTNPDILKQLKPDIIMVALNFSRKIEKEVFVNFHDKRPQAQDYKIRHAFKDTPFYGAYMTDIIKDFEEKTSDKVMTYLKTNKEFEMWNIRLFQEELNDLGTKNPLIIAFGSLVYRILCKHFGNQHRIIKVPHYSNHISMEDYRKQIWDILM